MRIRMLASFPLVAFVMFASSASADWPMARHDSRRTGAATGNSDITAPVPYWRAYLGGRLAGASLLTADVDGDGALDLIFIAGGRVTAKKSNGDLIWKSDAYGVRTLSAIDDVDGDGALDVVTATTNQVSIFNAKSGTLEWQEDPGEMGVIGGVRVGDLDGDKKPDVVVMECSCCGVVSGKSAFGYSFGSGFSPAKRLWEAPYVTCGGSTTMTLLDADGDGTLEVVDAQDNVLHLLGGSTGTELGASGDLGVWTAISPCFGANVDGRPGDELICFKSYIDAKPSNHQVFVVHYDATTTPALSVLWSRDVGDIVGLSAAPEPLLDLDGDGTLEIVASGKTSAGTFTSSVLDAATGTVLGTVPLRIDGSARLQSKDKTILLASDDTNLFGWTFDRAASPPVKQIWKISSRYVATYPDPAALRVSAVFQRTIAIDANGDGFDDFMSYDTVPLPSLIEIDTAASGVPTAFASDTLPAGTNVTQSWLTPGLPAGGRFAVARSDGTLTLEDTGLKQTTKPPIPVGGYYPPGGFGDLQLTPVVGLVDSGPSQAVVVPDSRGALLRLDATIASFASPPTIVWQRTQTSTPSIVAHLDGSAPAITCIEQVPPISAQKFNVVAVKGDGTTLWTSPLDGIPLGDVIPGKLSSGATPDLVLQWGHTTDLIAYVRAISGAAGAKLWDSAPNTPGAGRGIAGHSVADWNGDGIDDVLFQGAGTHVLSGSDSTEIATGGPPDAYFMLTPYDVDSDGIDELTYHGGLSPARTLKHDLTTTIWSGEDDRPFPYGAIAGCPTVPVLVESSRQYSSHLNITPLSGPSAGVYKTLVLAGGKAYDSDAAALAVGSRLGQLTSANIHVGLSGASTIRALVGSTDGWLYAVDPCSGTLAFAYEFQDPVGQPVFGDTDGDGRDEIIVAAGDGYLYDLRNEVLPAPSYVWDIDPEHGLTAADVNTTENATTLSGKWAAVTGADSYEVAAVGPDGRYLTTPSWTNVGDVNQTTISKLSLDLGSKYTFAVRGVAASKAVGPDRVSDGITRVAAAGEAGDVGPEAGRDSSTSDAVTDATADVSADSAGGTDEGSSGCGCKVTGQNPSEAGAGIVIAAVAVLCVGARRRRNLAR